MRDELGSYREELERMKLTGESKKALAARLGRRQRREQPRRGLRLAGGLRQAAVIAAAVCLLTSAAVAVVAASPTLRDSVFGEGGGYEQSSAFIGRSIEKNGWTLTITDCVGDDLDWYLGLELEAPEGTVLDEENYFFGEDQNDITLDFPDLKADGGQKGLRQIPDDNAADNRLSFLVHARAFAFFDGSTGSFNGQRVRLVFPGLSHENGTWIDEETGWEFELISDCDEIWDFGTLTVSYPDSTIRLEPNLPVTTLDVEAAITEVEISPLSVRVLIEGDALKGHHSWVPRNAPDGYYGCMEYQEIILYSEDGSEFSVVCEDSDLSGSGCSGGTEPSEDGYLVLRRTYGRTLNGIPSRLVDVDSLTAISICGVVIPLR